MNEDKKSAWVTSDDASPSAARTIFHDPLAWHIIISLLPVGIALFASMLSTTVVHPSLLLAHLTLAIPFFAILLIETYRRDRSPARHAALVMVPGVVTIFGSVAIATSESSTAAIGYVFLPFISTCGAAVSYGIVFLGEKMLRRYSAVSRSVVLISSMAMLGLAIPACIAAIHVLEQTRRESAVQAILQEAPSLKQRNVISTRATDIVPGTDKASLFALEPHGISRDSLGSVDNGSPGVSVDAVHSVAYPQYNSLAVVSSDPLSVVLWQQPWGREIVATDRDGSVLWKHTDIMGINNIACRDIDGDGICEIIIGHIGGVQVLDVHGVRKWRDTTIGNVRSVDAADLDGDGASEIVAASSRPTLHIFTSSGTLLRVLQIPAEARVIRVVRGATESDKPLLIVAGHLRGGAVNLTACDIMGKVQWSRELPVNSESAMVYLACAPDQRMLAVAAESMIYVVSTKSGEIIGAARVNEKIKKAVWVERPRQNASSISDLVIIAGRRMMIFKTEQ